MTLTENEKSILNIVATSEFNAVNGSIPRHPEESPTWMFIDEIAEDSGLTVNQCKGVLGSLVKKGIVDIDDIDNDETLIQITKAGIDELWK
jgi:hypothetical protein